MNAFLHVRKRILSSIALLVMLFNLCAPALSHVVLSASSGQDFLAEICTTTGTKFIKLDTNDSESSGHSSVRAQSDCAVCAWSFHLVDTPPVHLLGVQASSSSHFLPHTTSSAPDIQARWIPSAPRAPPVSL
jgi:hypothetical protein